MQKIRVFLGWVGVVALLLFIILNFEKININFWFVSRIETPIAFVVFGSAAIGALSVYMFLAYRRSRDKK